MNVFKIAANEFARGYVAGLDIYGQTTGFYDNLLKNNKIEDLGYVLGMAVNTFTIFLPAYLFREIHLDKRITGSVLDFDSSARITPKVLLVENLGIEQKVLPELIDQTKVDEELKRLKEIVVKRQKLE
jgi:hypothetical protein